MQCELDVVCVFWELERIKDIVSVHVHVHACTRACVCVHEHESMCNVNLIEVCVYFGSWRE